MLLVAESTTAVEMRDSPADPHEVAEDALAVEVGHDLVALAAAHEAGGDDRPAQSLDGPGDVDALAPGQDDGVGGPVAHARLEVGHGHGAIESRVESDCENHVEAPLDLVRDKLNSKAQLNRRCQ